MLFDKLDVVTVFKTIVYPQQDAAVKWLRASLEEQFGGQIVTSFAVNEKGQSVLSGRITQDDPNEMEFMHTRNALHRLLGEATERADAESGQERIDFELAAHDDVIEPAGAEPVPPPLALPTTEEEPELRTPLGEEPVGRRIKGRKTDRTPEWASDKSSGLTK